LIILLCIYFAQIASLIPSLVKSLGFCQNYGLPRFTPELPMCTPPLPPDPSSMVFRVHLTYCIVGQTGWGAWLWGDLCTWHLPDTHTQGPPPLHTHSPQHNLHMHKCLSMSNSCSCILSTQAWHWGNFLNTGCPS